MPSSRALNQIRACRARGRKTSAWTKTFLFTVIGCSRLERVLDSAVGIDVVAPGLRIEGALSPGPQIPGRSEGSQPGTAERRRDDEAASWLVDHQDLVHLDVLQDLPVPLGHTISICRMTFAAPRPKCGVSLMVPGLLAIEHGFPLWRDQRHALDLCDHG